MSRKKNNKLLSTVKALALSARENIGQAIALAERNGNPLKIIRLINRAGKKLHKADKVLLEHHVNDCVIKKDLFSTPAGIAEIIKSYRYRS